MASRSPATLREMVLGRARLLGFEHVGIARADVPLDVDHARYVSFVEAGMQGTMGYLAEHVEARRRLDGPEILAGAKSIICIAKPYGRSKEAEEHDPATARLIARYARGRDYHNHLRRKLRLLARFLRSLEPGTKARPMSDVEPVLERAWASRAGLGFVGKNGLVIVPGRGSFVLLGEVVTTLDLAPNMAMTERCGSCTRCLDACPTNAFSAPFVLDPRKCIAYHTIESPDAPPEELRAAIGEHLFGCDDCQSVCPFNRARPPDASTTQQYAPLPIWSEVDLVDLVQADDARFEHIAIGSPVKRAARRGLARNALLVAARRLSRSAIGDANDGEAASARRVLESGAESPDPFLATLARSELEKIDR